MKNLHPRMSCFRDLSAELDMFVVPENRIRTDLGERTDHRSSKDFEPLWLVQHGPTEVILDYKDVVEGKDLKAEIAKAEI